MVQAPARPATATRRVTATEARVHLGEMIRAVTERGQDVIVEKSGQPQVVMISVEDYDEFRRLRPKPQRKNWAEDMMELHRKIAAEWKGPPLTAEDVDDMINYGQR